MNKIKIGIICPSEIAFRRFMPALKKLDGFEFAGIAIANSDEWNGEMTEGIKVGEEKKAQSFVDMYGGKIYYSYFELISSQEIDAIYLPLPPALHYKWAKMAIENHKHVFLEKPSTTCVNDTRKLIEIAKDNNVALHENYMFIYHNQINVIKELITSKEIGNVRLIRADFGFPKRAENDFRYNKELGGGALLDCGGYPIKLVQDLLGMDVQVDSARLMFNHQSIDLYGSAQLSNEHSIAQVSFGMDNSYKCCLEIWGSNGIIQTERIFSAPDSLKCQINISCNNELRTIEVKPDDTFKKSLEVFEKSIYDSMYRQDEYEAILNQMILVEKVMDFGGLK